MNNILPTILTFIDVGYDIEKKKYYTTVLKENNIFIPDRYFLRMFQNGLIDKLINVVLDINIEQDVFELNSLMKIFNREETNGDNEQHIIKKRKLSEENNTNETMSSYSEPQVTGINEDEYENEEFLAW
ncbi:unnamed protein product [Rotaria magnacalcarata]|uniref:Uncharacterized protein n=1 Tax=Rotaria magnacalcarata TaxID=392030 RepID=A0A816HDS7_9BILA|nr:unnamed protein product [Rotaria magnacalcarata]CAF2148993.1 unnamed protein product [Rotaria magnacalcarata]CAF4024471.1 unnamed protein product [Rotaria magnacalcarata]CAF4098640.1 unnamed protein product [Rotaria magnacalcarata]